MSVKLRAASPSPAPAPHAIPTTGDVWIKHDDDLRYLRRVLEAGQAMTDEDRQAAIGIVHGLRTTARGNYLAPHATQPNQRAINDSMLDRTSPRYSENDLRRMLDGIEASAKEFGLVMMAGALGGFSFRKHATQAQAGPQYSDKAYIGDLEYELNRRDDLAKCASDAAMSSTPGAQP